VIGVDTNVVLRAMLGDDPGHSPRARRLIGEAGPGRVRVNIVVMLEAIRVQRRRSAPDRARLADMVEELLDTSEFVIEHRDAVARAIRNFRTGPAGFEDYLIGELNREAGCSTTFTFDDDASRSPGFTIVPA
jgi:predicted nucleic-acid-binding protein